MSAFRLPVRVAMATVALLIAPLALHSPSHAAGPPDCGVLSDGVHQVTNSTELQAVGSGGNGAGECGLGASYRQTANITIPSGHGFWEPIGSTADPFVGTFDGNNLTITGLQLDDELDDVQTPGIAPIYASPPRGLFGLVGSSGLLTNVRIHSFSFESVEFRENLGALAGAVNGGTIANSHVEVDTLKASNISQQIGGLVGRLDNGSIQNSSSQIDATAGSFSVGRVTGGLVGASSNSTIEDSFATGHVAGTTQVGGLVGQALSSSTIRRSYANGNVGGTSSFIGGLIGQIDDATIEDSFARVNVAGHETSGGNVGGLVGDARNNATISRSYSTGTVTGHNNVGGLIGFSQNSNVSDSFWDVTTSNIGAEDSTSASAGGVGKTTEQLTTLSTFTNTDMVGLDAPWPIVERWQSFDPDDNKVWGIRSDLNDGYPYLLWEYETIPGGECAVVHGTAEPALVDGSYVIDSVQKLVYLSVNQDSGDPEWRTRDFVQTAPIDLGGCSWTPIGSAASPFAGSFDGADHTIDGLFRNVAGSETAITRVGLFASIGPTGHIRSVTLTNVALTTAVANSSIGSLAGENRGIITGSSGTGSVTGRVNNQITVGGLVGLNLGEIRQSSAHITVTNHNGNAGGLVGDDFEFVLELEESVVGTISDSSASGSVTGGGNSVGGLIGVISGTVTSSSATGSVSGSAATIGGFAGNTVGTVTHSFAAGTVSSTGNASSGGTQKNVGGLSGVVSGTVDQSFASGAVSAAGNVSGTGFLKIGGLVGSLSGTGTLTNSYSQGNVTANGNVSGGSLYVGGLTGDVRGTLTNSYSQGNVTANGNVSGGTLYVGGLTGFTSVAGNITNTITWGNTTSVGTVTAPGERFTGGFVGQSSGAITGSFWDNDVSAMTESDGGSGVTAESSVNLQTLSTFENADWSIAFCRTTGEDTVWGILPGGYPFLTWQDTPQLAACTTTAEPSSPSSRPRPTPNPTALEPVASVTPQQFGGASTDVADSEADTEPTLDVPVAVDETPDPDAGGAGGDPAVAGSDSDTEALGVGQTSGNSAWLWAIGLGGLGAVALIAGGVAFARMRP